MPGPHAFHNHPLLLCHPVSPHTVGRGLDPSAARRGRRPLQRWPETIPAPMHARGGLRAGRPTIFRSPPCRGRACPARNLPAACRQSFQRAPIPPNHLIPQPAHPSTPIICARQLPSPQYTPCPNFTLKLCRKNQKNLQKPVDKGHTTCYNNQAVSRAQPAAAAAGAFTYSLYTVF